MDDVGVLLCIYNSWFQMLVLTLTALSEFFVIQSHSENGDTIAKCFIKNTAYLKQCYRSITRLIAFNFLHFVNLCF